MPYDMIFDQPSKVAINARDVVSTDTGQLSIYGSSGIVFFRYFFLNKNEKLPNSGLPSTQRFFYSL